MEIDESLLSFPCEFPIKAMGKADNGFDLLVAGLVRKHSSDLRENAVKSRFSNGGRYISVTVTIQAESREQLDRIYLDLTAEKRVLMAL
tara:strand:+ start:65 stop:331 length:267 start_codon:yes stop_codon:yes gene_type:complete